jgi:hypothetical protein
MNCVHCAPTKRLCEFVRYSMHKLLRSRQNLQCGAIPFDGNDLPLRLRETRPLSDVVDSSADVVEFGGHCCASREHPAVILTAR